MFKKNLALYVSYSVLMAAATVGTMTMQSAEKNNVVDVIPRSTRR